MEKSEDFFCTNVSGASEALKDKAQVISQKCCMSTEGIHVGFDVPNYFVLRGRGNVLKTVHPFLWKVFFNVYGSSYLLCQLLNHNTKDHGGNLLKE